jgi:cellulose synthase/poly-beta-1,6-N-acetylglucosamine synthase-like glycosyltransferase
MSAVEWTYWGALALGLYPYAGYPLVAWLLGRLRRRRVAWDETHAPRVTVVTAARNEAACIEATIRNKLAQDYPADRLDLIVISDESDDGTDAIVARIAAGEPRVRLLRQSPRAGKTSALNLAVPQARGEIVVFADANSMYRPQALRRLVRNFADAKVGYVTGQMVYATRAASSVSDGLGAYMRLENWLRAQETAIGSVVGVDGGIDAVRKRLFRAMSPDQLPDFVLPLDVVEQGARVVYEPEALLEEEALSSGEQEFRMRVRVALRALWALSDKRALLNPLRHGVFAFQLASHKLLRYLSFAPLALAFLAGLWLAAGGGIYAWLAAGQLAIVLLAWLGWQGRGLKHSRLQKLSLYFVLVNLASAMAAKRFLRGEKVVLWQPRTG